MSVRAMAAAAVVGPCEAAAQPSMVWVVTVPGTAPRWGGADVTPVMRGCCGWAAERQGAVGVETGAAAATAAPGASSAAATEQTYIMIKPDGVQRGLIGEIIGRFERKGLKLVAMKFAAPSKELLEEHYADLREKKFFPGLIACAWGGAAPRAAGRAAPPPPSPHCSRRPSTQT